MPWVVVLVRLAELLRAVIGFTQHAAAVGLVKEWPAIGQLH